ncbi:MAG: 3'-5' exonuclease [Lentisphaeraceae bacterium]|nr:3'-5' exonuclease [Lentisphaeraceae bacterium]
MFYCIDFESTGAVNGQEPLEFAWLAMDLKGEIISHREIGFSKVRGGRLLEGIDEKVDHLRDLWPLVRDTLQNKVIVGHNVNYDLSLLTKTFPGFQTAGQIDTLTIYRQLYGEQIGDYSLSALLDVFQLTEKLEKMKLNEHFEAHRALYDACGCALLLQRLLQDPHTASLFQPQSQGELF